VKKKVNIKATSQSHSSAPIFLIGYIIANECWESQSGRKKVHVLRMRT